MSIKHQVAINATETVKAKITLESEDKSQGVMINEYHTEIFNTPKFMEKMLKKQQKLRLVWLVPHIKTRQAVERAINTVVNMESAILMQA